MGSAVLQYGHYSSDTARRRWARRKLGTQLSARSAQAGVLEARGRACVGRAGERAGGRCRQLGARVQGAVGARACGAGGSRQGALGAGARGGSRLAATSATAARGAGGMGAQAGYRLCTRCTRPVFNPVRLGIVPESIFGHYS